MLVAALIAPRPDSAGVRPALTGLPLLAIGLGVPGYGMLGLYGVWALIVAVAIGARHAHPWLIPAFPPATLAITYRLLLLGGELFKWSA